MKNAKQSTAKLTLTAIFMALIVVMTVTPFFGYISYGPIEITTLHIATILASCCLGIGGGVTVGLTFGVTSLLRSFMNPLWAAFSNPLISVLPRVLLGLLAALIFKLLRKTKLPLIVSLVITAAASTILHTAMVLTAYNVFGSMISDFAAVVEMLRSIMLTVITLNGSVELIAAIILVPALYMVVRKILSKNGVSIYGD